MGPIGIFDSGYGGLTVFKEILKELPQYNYIYLGDNARVPYGTRSFETVYEYTKQCVNRLFEMDCPIVILACNTASAKALKTIQQNDLVGNLEERKVLGVIRPTTEIIGSFTKTRHIGILATPGTVNSNSYPIEIKRFFPDVKVYQEPCPMWVPIVENNMIGHKGTAFYIKENIDNLLAQSPKIDTFVLACTHYPVLYPLIRQLTPPHILIVSQGELVSASLRDYLKRHPEINDECIKEGEIAFYTTESEENFNEKAALFFEREVQAKHISLGLH
jgi:glutamate racemase